MCKYKPILGTIEGEEDVTSDVSTPLKRFVIPHPGTGEWIEGLTFDEAMEKWFEGFNVPRMIMDDGKPEGFSVSCQRVRDYFGRGEV